MFIHMNLYIQIFLKKLHNNYIKLLNQISISFDYTILFFYKKNELI